MAKKKSLTKDKVRWGYREGCLSSNVYHEEDIISAVEKDRKSHCLRHWNNDGIHYHCPFEFKDGWPGSHPLKCDNCRKKERKKFPCIIR